MLDKDLEKIEKFSQDEKKLIEFVMNHEVLKNILPGKYDINSIKEIFLSNNIKLENIEIFCAILSKINLILKMSDDFIQVETKFNSLALVFTFINKEKSVDLQYFTLISYIILDTLASYIKNNKIEKKSKWKSLLNNLEKYFSYFEDTDNYQHIKQVCEEKIEVLEKKTKEKQSQTWAEKIEAKERNQQLKIALAERNLLSAEIEEIMLYLGFDQKSADGLLKEIDDFKCISDIEEKEKIVLSLKSWRSTIGKFYNKKRDILIKNAKNLTYSQDSNLENDIDYEESEKDEENEKKIPLRKILNTPEFEDLEKKYNLLYEYLTNLLRK